MSILDLVSTLNELDISVQIVENRLEFEAPDGIMTPELIDEIKENKEELIKFLSQRHEIKVYPTLRPASKKEYYILSSPQKRMYLLQQLDLESTAYNIPTIINLDIAIDKNILYDIFRTLIDRHDSLRSSFEIINNEPVQRIHCPNDMEFRIETYDLKNQMQNFSCRYEQLFRGFVRPFDLSKAPLLRVGLSEAQGAIHLLIDMHHIISDGISFRVLEEEIRAIIDDQILPALQFQYKDYAEWLIHPDYRKIVESQDEYWLRKFSDDFPLIDLPWDYPRPTVQSFMGKKVRFRLNEEETAIIKDITKATGATVFMVILSLYSIMLSKLSGDEDIIVGTPIAGRRHHYLGRIIGVFINTLAIRSFPLGQKSYKEFLDELKESTLEAFENQDYQFEELVEKSAVSRDTGRNPITDVLFNHLNQVEHLKESLKLFEVEGYFHEEGIAKFDLTLTTLEYEDRIYCSFEYCTQLFEPQTVERFIGYFKKIISGISYDFERKIRDIRIIPGEEMDRILFEFNDTKADYPIDKPIHRFFEEQVERIPDNIALCCEDMNFSYDSLNERVEQLAGALRKDGIGSGSIVGIMVERSPEMVSGILGILRSAGAYLPIDPGFPRDRIYYILKDSRAEILLTTHRLYNDVVKTRDLDIRKVFLEEVKKLSKNEFAEETVENPAYVIYTSGSTGLPKGVPISHKSAVNILTALHKEYPFMESDTYLLKTSYIFDVSVTELFGWFFGGGRLSLLEKGGEKDPKVIVAAIQDDFITHINFVPSMFTLFIDELNPEALSKISSLKYIFLAGEALLPELVKKIVNLDTKIVLENIYGPTEGAVYSSNYSLRDWDFRGSVPIGKPMQNIRLYVLDENNCLLPVGVTGELCISGENLAPGYLNQPELTAANFTANPYRADMSVPYNVLYRTGDLARWHEDGNIEFLNRKDKQVKIRGYRVEPGEIENHLLRIEGIKEAIVIDREEEHGYKNLCAYIVPDKVQKKKVLKSQVNKGFVLDIMAVKYELSKELPDYMIPSYFVELDEVPLTHSGKVDRKLLPSPRIEDGAGYIGPRNELEKRLVEIWSEVLHVDKKTIGIDKNFFEIGGHSLRATILASRLNKEFNINLRLIELFSIPTIIGIANLISISKSRRERMIVESEERERVLL